MTMFGLQESEVATLIRSITSDKASHDEIRTAFARATWTGIVEPGDRTAGLVIEALGAGDALDGVVARWPAEQWAAAMKQAGIIGVGDVEIPLAEFQQAVERWQPRLKSAAALLAIRQAARYGVKLLTPEDSELWPAGLDDLGLHQPIALWSRGNDAAIKALGKSVALVGARAATGYGEHVTMELSAGLVDRGFAIVSGAAYGIDGMAHRAALASSGKTIAFLAGGVDRFYPSGHDALLARIVEEGAVISEMPCGQPPTKWRFLQRNRLIAAASQATVVIEAGWRSGSLNTGGHAMELGRKLGAIPGPVNSAASAGCHRLIRDYGATLVTTPDEIEEMYNGDKVATDPIIAAFEREGAAAESNALATIHERVLTALSVSAPRTIADVAARSGLPVAVVDNSLSQLLDTKHVTERERGWIKLRPTI